MLPFHRAVTVYVLSSWICWAMWAHLGQWLISWSMQLLSLNPNNFPALFLLLSTHCMLKLWVTLTVTHWRWQVCHCISPFNNSIEHSISLHPPYWHQLEFTWANIHHWSFRAYVFSSVTGTLTKTEICILNKDTVLISHIRWN